MTISKYNVDQITKDRSPMQVGYKAYNGATITCQPHIDEYNRLCDEVYRWEDSGRGVPEHVLNERHRHFVVMCDIALESQRQQPVVDRLTAEGAKYITPTYSIFVVSDHGNYSLAYRGNSAIAATREIFKLIARDHNVECRVNGMRFDWSATC